MSNLSSKRLDVQFHDMLHRDQTGLSAGLVEVLKTVAGFWWATESRGPYEWDDAHYRDEMGNMLRAIRKAAQDAVDKWKRGPLPSCVLERSQDETAEQEQPEDNDPGCPCYGRDMPGCKENCPAQKAELALISECVRLKHVPTAEQRKAFIRGYLSDDTPPVKASGEPS